MNREYNCKVSSKNSKRLLKNLQNTTGGYFFGRTLYVCFIQPSGCHFLINWVELSRKKLINMCVINVEMRQVCIENPHYLWQCRCINVKYRQYTGVLLFMSQLCIPICHQLCMTTAYHWIWSSVFLKKYLFGQWPQLTPSSAVLCDSVTGREFRVRF